MKLKYFFTTLYALSLCWSLQAAPVDKVQAMKLASRYVRLNTSKKLLQVASPTITDDLPAYYIFNDKEQKGFVIISGDDRTTPVLGYSSSGQLNPQHLPEPLAKLLSAHTEQLERLKGTTLTPGIPTPHPHPNPKAVKGPLLRSHWNQNAPFNDQTPLIGTEHTVTGCVATAMAQLMYYYKWPVRGTGTHSYWHNTGKLSVNFAESVYDWENMLPEYIYADPSHTDPKQRRPQWNNVQATAVAKLMSDVGIAISTRYDLISVGSGSNVAEAATALSKHFGYHTQTVYRDYTPNHKFLATIKQELDQARPILMVGSQETSGHAWVIDGYDENGYLHVNWGWGGLSNGYFALSFMSPDNAGIGGFVGNYSEGQVLLLAYPNKEGSKGFEVAPGDCAYLLPNAGLRYNSSQTNLSNRQIGIKMERLGKRKNPAFQAAVAIALRNHQGELLQLTEHTHSLIGKEHNGIYHDILMTLTLPQHLNEGAYSLHTLYKAANKTDDPWKEAGNDIPLYFLVQGGKIVLPTIAQQTGVSLHLTAPPQQLTPLWKGEAASVRLSIANPTPFNTEFGEIVLRLKKAEKVYEVVVEKFRFYDHSHYDGLVSVSSTHPRPLEVGTYDVEFLFRRPGIEYTISNPFGAFRLEVLESTGMPLLSLAQDYGSRNGISRSLTIKKGEQLWNDERIALQSLTGSGLTIHSILINKGEATYHGPLTFALIDPLTGDKHLIETKSNQTMVPYLLTDLFVEIPYTLLERLPKEKRYELHIFATIEGKERDVWGQGVYRRTLMIAEADDSPISGISDTQEGVLMHFAQGSLSLRGIRPGEPIQIVTLNGRKIYQTIMPPMQEVLLPLQGLPAGVYILRAEGRHRKFILP